MESSSSTPPIRNYNDVNKFKPPSTRRKKATLIDTDITSDKKGKRSLTHPDQHIEVPDNSKPSDAGKSPPRSEKPKPVVDIITEIPKPIQTVREMCIGETFTDLKMTPQWFEQENEQEAMTGIVYPSYITNERPFDAIAHYRRAMHQTNNFRRQSIRVGEDELETIVIALDEFAHQFGGDLCVTNREISFSESTYRTACGVADLGSTHLLATNSIRTAKFTFNTELNYKKDLARSRETMSNFVLTFATAIAEVLGLSGNEYVRVFSVKKDEDHGNAQVNFGLTVPDVRQTRTLARELENYARGSFRSHKGLKYVVSDKYKYEWAQCLTYLQLQSQDFIRKYNFDYNRRGLTQVARRGGYPYYVPTGWYRHAIDLSQKYLGDARWLGCANVPGEWPIAYYGTHAEVARENVKNDLSSHKMKSDPMRAEAVEQLGEKVDSPGFYLHTRCKGGAHPWYTKTFAVNVSKEQESRFRIVFQCRVKPGEFTSHISPTTGKETWRVVDPDAVRPYGLLVRKRKARKKPEDQSESEDDLYGECD